MTHQLNQSPHLILILIIPSKINPTVINFFLKKKQIFWLKNQRKSSKMHFPNKIKNK